MFPFFSFIFWHGVRSVNTCPWIMWCCWSCRECCKKSAIFGPEQHFSFKGDKQLNLDLWSLAQARSTATGRFITFWRWVSPAFITDPRDDNSLLFNYTHESTLWIMSKRQDKALQHNDFRWDTKPYTWLLRARPAAQLSSPQKKQMMAWQPRGLFLSLALGIAWPPQPARTRYFQTQMNSLPPRGPQWRDMEGPRGTASQLRGVL